MLKGSNKKLDIVKVGGSRYSWEWMSTVIGFCNLNSKSFRIIFYAASFAWPLIFDNVNINVQNYKLWWYMFGKCSSTVIVVSTKRPSGKDVYGTKNRAKINKNNFYPSLCRAFQNKTTSHYLSKSSVPNL